MPDSYIRRAMDVGREDTTRFKETPKKEIGNRVNCYGRYPTEDIGAEAAVQSRAGKNNTKAVASV